MLDQTQTELELQKGLSSQLDRLEILLKPIATNPANNGVVGGNANININAGGFGLRIAVTCCIMMFFMMLVGTISVGFIIGQQGTMILAQNQSIAQQNQKIASQKDDQDRKFDAQDRKMERLQDYINAVYMMSGKAKDSTRSRKHP